MNSLKVIGLFLLIAVTSCRQVETHSFKNGYTLPLPDMIILRNKTAIVNGEEKLMKYQDCIVKFNLTNPTDSTWLIYPAINSLYTDSAKYTIKAAIFGVELNLLGPHSSKQIIIGDGYKSDKYWDFDSTISYASEIPRFPCSYFKSREEAEDYFSDEHNRRVVIYKNYHPTIITLDNPVIICDTIHANKPSCFVYDYWTHMDYFYYNFFR